MIDVDSLTQNDLEALPPDRAKFILAETKLKLQNIMTHLEMLETRLARTEDVNGVRHKAPSESLVNAKPR